MTWHRGVAMARGIFWTESVVRRHPELLARAWPGDGKAEAIARRKVADLGHDERVLERLCSALMESAARRWGQLQRDPAAVDLVLRSVSDRERKRAARQQRG